MTIKARILSGHGPITDFVDMDVESESEGPSRQRWVGSFPAPANFELSHLPSGKGQLEIPGGTTTPILLLWMESGVVHFHCPSAPKLEGF